MESSKINKIINLKVRVAPAEAEFIKMQATKAGLSLSEYLRKVSQKYEVKERLPQESRRALQGIGNNLNQLTAYAHKGELHVGKINEVLDQLKQVLKK